MSEINYQRFLLFSLILFSSILLSNGDNDKPENGQEIWEQDLTDHFQIDASTEGIQKVNLKCGSDSMHVQLETEKDFSGVMYTRGSFYKQAEPCYVRPKEGRSRSLEMKFTLNQCQTLQDGDVFSNIVIVQHDPELVTPGDAAFSVECDFRQPRNIDVGAEMQTRDKMVVGSRITLTSPDPSMLNPIEVDALHTAHSDSDSVTFIPQNEFGLSHKTIGTVESISIDEDEHQVLQNTLPTTTPPATMKIPRTKFKPKVYSFQFNSL